MLPDGGFRGLGRIRYYCSIIKSLYFKVNFQLLFQVSNMLYGGSSGVQCNSTGCWVFPELWSAGQPVKCNLTAFCPQPSTPIPGCAPWCFCTRHQWSCIWAMTALQPTGKPLFLHFDVAFHHGRKYLCPVVASLGSLKAREVFHTVLTAAHQHHPGLCLPRALS